MATKTTKKVVEKTPTLQEQLNAEKNNFKCLAEKYEKLAREYNGLRNSFDMVKNNFEREKNRLDKLIDTSLNNSKPLVVVKNNDYCLEYKV